MLPNKVCCPKYKMNKLSYCTLFFHYIQSTNSLCLHYDHSYTATLNKLQTRSRKVGIRQKEVAQQYDVGVYTSKTQDTQAAELA